MLQALTLLFLCQLAGEVLVRALGIVFPGPVLGMALLPDFLKGYITRTNFSFTAFVKDRRNSASELYDWTRDIYRQFDYIIDPHGAVGYLAWKAYEETAPGTTGIVLETAHPAKFLEDVEAVLGIEVPVPAPPTLFQQRLQLRRGLELGAPLNLSWSCYEAEDKACGRCDSCTLRLQGFKDYLAEHGGGTAKVVEEVEFNVGAGAPDLITKTQALLTKYPKDSFKWILGPYDESLVPILATAKQRDRTEIKALGFDGEPVALESIAADGGQAATIAWGTEWIAWAGIDECNRALNKTEVGVNKDFPLQLIIKDNVTPGKRYDPGLDFKAEYRAMWDAAK